MSSGARSSESAASSSDAAASSVASITPERGGSLTLGSVTVDSESEGVEEPGTSRSGKGGAPGGGGGLAVGQGLSAGALAGVSLDDAPPVAESTSARKSSSSPSSEGFEVSVVLLGDLSCWPILRRDRSKEAEASSLRARSRARSLIRVVDSVGQMAVRSPCSLPKMGIESSVRLGHSAGSALVDVVDVHVRKDRWRGSMARWLARPHPKRLVPNRGRVIARATEHPRGLGRRTTAEQR